jgi:hypothetical protein
MIVRLSPSPALAPGDHKVFVAEQNFSTLQELQFFIDTLVVQRDALWTHDGKPRK